MSTRTCVVTGSNKGIGLAIVRLLAEQQSQMIVYLTSRNVTLGEAALAQLKTRVDKAVAHRLRFHQLDITDVSSCTALASHLKTTHGGLDLLVNNAGIAYKQAANESPAEQAKWTNHTNYFGLRNVCDALFPILNKDARVVNMQSRAGLLTASYGDELKARFKSPTLTIAQLDALVNEFVERAATVGLGNGWPTTTYGFSKAAGIALTILQQKQFDAQGNNVIVNAVCPGYVDTDMSSHKGHLTVEEGAATPIWLAQLPTDAKSPKGEFCHDLKIGEWEGQWK